MTPPSAGGVDFEVLVDARLADITWKYEQRWEGLAPSVRDWLREVLDHVLADVRQDVIAVHQQLQRE